MLVRRWVAVAVALGVVGVVIAVLYTPLLGVRSVSVTGLRGLTSQQVIAAAKVPSGAPMATLDTGAIGARVATLPMVAAVDVSREWPDTIVIAVTERAAIAEFAGSGGVHLVDANGVDFQTVAVEPAGLPRLQVSSAGPDDPRTQAMVRVLAALPAQLRPEVVTMSADTPGDVRLGLSTGKTVRWGSADDSARKGQVLAALMTQPGKVYDVSSPDLPTAS
jgi:cell division protein FtsQ